MAVSGNIDAAWQTMAEVLTTGPESPYYVRRTDSTIEYKTIDESRFAYMVMCELNSGGSAGAAGLLGVNITYRITAAKG
jgi:hypothetical protein